MPDNQATAWVLLGWTSMTTFTHDFHLRFYYFSRFEWLLWQEAGHFVKLLVLGKQTTAGCWSSHQYR